MASEKELAPAIDTVFRTAPRRIIVSSFASHIHRIQQVIDAASRYNRKVSFVGRSMIRNMTIAEELGYLNIPKGILVDFKALQRTDDHKVVLICTGSQGEPMAALSRMANKDHQIRIHEGDTVLMASSLIPGNENAIYGIINNLTKIGANVVHKGNAKVHVSGHASAGELAYCYNIVKPRNVMPVHGEWRHLKANGAIAEATGMDPRDVVLAENGMTVDLRRGRATISGKHQVDLVFVDGDSVGHTTEETLKERMQLAEEGAVTVLALVDADTGTLAEPAEFFTKGFTIKSEDLKKAEEAVEKALANAATGNRRGAKGEDLEDVIERAVANWMRRFYSRTPAITAIVVDA